MSVQENKRLVFKDSALMVRVSGAAFLIGSLAFFLSKMQFPAYAFIAAGVGLLLLSSDLTITADRSTRVLRLQYRYFLFQTTREIPFDDIEDFKVIRSSRTSHGHSSTGYRLVVVLKSGGTVSFRIYSAGEDGKKQQASRLRTFINGHARRGSSSAQIEEDTHGLSNENPSPASNPESGPLN